MAVVRADLPRATEEGGFRLTGRWVLHTAGQTPAGPLAVLSTQDPFTWSRGGRSGTPEGRTGAPFCLSLSQVPFKGPRKAAPASRADIFLPACSHTRSATTKATLEGDRGAAGGSRSHQLVRPRPRGGAPSPPAPSGRAGVSSTVQSTRREARGRDAGRGPRAWRGSPGPRRTRTGGGSGGRPARPRVFPHPGGADPPGALPGLALGRRRRARGLGDFGQLRASRGAPHALPAAAQRGPSPGTSAAGS